ncbi:hypothetical protein G5I_04458 [Acromyrmex echinatior]|uniref:Uncharacterized protein n=1 Tax=Acromyrmex echinatior TaxID=103372 RepID=F4WFP9_ACREC|nr:hypothetical protein G5I_04458 [Acromyrmex echinatior]
MNLTAHIGSPAVTTKLTFNQRFNCQLTRFCQPVLANTLVSNWAQVIQYCATSLPILRQYLNCGNQLLMAQHWTDSVWKTLHGSGGNVREGLVSVRTRAKDEEGPTRSAKDRHGLARGKRGQVGINAIYTMTTIAALLAQSAYVQPRKGVGWREKGDKRFCSREDGLGWQGGLEGERDESRDVCRTRYLANKTTWRRTEGTGVAPFADRRSSGSAEPAARGDDGGEGAKGKRADEERREAVRDVRKPRLAASSAHARFRLSSYTLPVVRRPATERRSSATPPRPRHVVVTRRTTSLEILLPCESGRSKREKRKKLLFYSTRLMHQNLSLDFTLVTHESRILTPGGSAISPGGAGPPASPSPGHYHPPTHSPPLVKRDVGTFRWVSNDSYSWPLDTMLHLKPVLLRSRRSDMSRIFCPSFSLSALLPESSAISEFDATSAIRYRPRKSDCSLWSRNNCGTAAESGEAGIAGNGFANRKGGKGGIEVERKREREREREGEERWMDEEKEADDDDGCKGGCPSSFSSAAAAANPSGDSTRQLSTNCRSLPLEKPRSKFNAERFLVHALLRWTAPSMISLIKKNMKGKKMIGIKDKHIRYYCVLEAHGAAAAGKSGLSRGGDKRRVELESGILSRVYVKPREINFETTRRKEGGGGFFSQFPASCPRRTAVGGAHYGIGRLALLNFTDYQCQVCHWILQQNRSFPIYPYRFLAKSLSGRNLRSGNNTEGASPGELHTVRDYGIRAKEGAGGGTGRSEELGLSGRPSSRVTGISHTFSMLFLNIFLHLRYNDDSHSTTASSYENKTSVLVKINRIVRERYHLILVYWVNNKDKTIHRGIRTERCSKKMSRILLRPDERERRRPQARRRTESTVLSITSLILFYVIHKTPPGVKSRSTLFRIPALEEESDATIALARKNIEKIDNISLENKSEVNFLLQDYLYKQLKDV